ncbi:MAG: hypothetical protein MUF24_06250 [Chitinophagaceae bacterium]|nr:hypothetical protein [Chitinophagaceae bacterium]
MIKIILNLLKNLLSILPLTIACNFVFAQNVGINTNSPAFTLDINGDLNLRSGFRLNGSRGDSGAVLMSRGASVAPAWSNWRGFKATADGNQVIESNTSIDFVLLNFDDISGGSNFTIGGGYNASTKQYTVPENGVYRIIASVGINSCPEGNYRLSVRGPNSTGAFASTTFVVNAALANVQQTLVAQNVSYLQAGTILGAYISDTNNSPITVNNGVSTYFSIVKIH